MYYSILQVDASELISKVAKTDPTIEGTGILIKFAEYRFKGGIFSKEFLWMALGEDMKPYT